MKSYKDITFRYLKVQKKRTILTIIGIILSVSLITGVGTMILSLREQMIKDAIDKTGDYHAVFLKVQDNIVDKIRKNVDALNSAVTIDEGYGVVAGVSEKEKESESPVPDYRYLSIRGYDSSSLKMFPINLKEGRMPENPGEIILDFWMMQYFPGKPKLGDSIRLDIGFRKDNKTGNDMTVNSWSSDEIFEKTGEKEYKIVGLMRPGIILSDAYVASAITFIDGSSLSDNRDYNVFVKFKGVTGVYKRGEKIAHNLGIEKVKGSNGTLEYPIKYNEEVLRLSAQSFSASLNKAAVMMLGFILLLIIMSTIAVIYNAFNISVLERISQFGILRCVGASPKQIRGFVLKEATVLSIIGIPLGLISGLIAMKVVLYLIGRMNFELFGNLDVVFSWEVLLASSVLGLFTVYLSAFGPARQASRISPLEAVRNTGGLKKEKFKKVKNSRLARILFGFEGQIAFKNLRRNKKRFRVTVFSMVISIVLFISFGTFVDYTFKIGAANIKEMGDFMVSYKGKDKNGFSIEKYNEIKALPGIDLVFKYYNTNQAVLVPESIINPIFREIRGDMLSEKRGNEFLTYNNALISYGDETLKELKKRLKEGSIDKDAIDKQSGVILVKNNMIFDDKRNRNFIMDVYDYRVGDTIKLPLNSVKGPGNHEEEAYKTVKVMGILEKGILSEEYNTNGGIFMITTEDVYENITGSKVFNSIFIKLNKNADKEIVSKYLRDMADRELSYQYMDYSETARDMNTAAMAISIFLYGFVAVITLIGCLNIINTISTNLILRTRELSILKAVGMTKNGIKKMVCLEGFFYGIIAAFYGAIVGTICSYLFFNILINIRVFEWWIPWDKIIIAVTGATLVALVSSYFPLRKINKGIIIENIRVEE